MKEAQLYKKLDKKQVQCFACSHRCKILADSTGICGIRQNKEGKLYLLVYGRVVAANIDPIEKKPLFHFIPGSYAFSIGTLGCNFRCQNCQNFDISQIYGHKGEVVSYDQIDWGLEFSPSEIVREAKKTGCQSIAYTYNEPATWAEYALAVMKLAHKAGIKNVWVSNGFETRETLELVAPYLDAVNVDIKSFEDGFYRTNCGTHLQPVLDTCKRIYKKKIHLEITTLIIPTLSADEKMLRQIARFIKTELSPNVPWHISAFSGAISWKLKHLPETPVAMLKKAYQIGCKEGLNYVYAGNVTIDKLENTYCPKCGELLIKRSGFEVLKTIKTGKCPKCKIKIEGKYEKD